MFGFHHDSTSFCEHGNSDKVNPDAISKKQLLRMVVGDLSCEIRFLLGVPECQTSSMCVLKACRKDQLGEVLIADAFIPVTVNRRLGMSPTSFQRVRDKLVEQQV